jgi:hypothetical protein
MELLIFLLNIYLNFFINKIPLKSKKNRHAFFKVTEKYVYKKQNKSFI